MSPRGEFAWIDRLVELLAEGGSGIGDDVAAVTDAGDGSLAWTIDTLVEGVHFRFDWMEPEAVGHRALAASLSDLAAATAEPIGALVTAAGPAAVLEDRLEGVYGGLGELARASGCMVMGGDLSRAEGPLHLTVTALGRCFGGTPPGRSGARPGDDVWVTGRLGAPAAAMALLRAAGDDPAGLATARAHPATARLARPEPRVAEARWLAARAELHATIDISDGLSGDAAHVADRSGARIAIEPALLPVHPAAVDAAAHAGGDALDWALHGGEEFELLVCAAAGALAPHADAFAGRFGIPLTRIGAVEPGSGVVRREDGRDSPLDVAAWDHFRVAPPDPRR